MTIDTGTKYSALLNFVDARITDDEHGAAMAIARGGREYHVPWRTTGYDVAVNPEWARRDLAGKRKMLRLAHAQLDHGNVPAVVATWRQVLLLLAAAWADHPDYRIEWDRP